jgi:hypothetical protein
MPTKKPYYKLTIGAKPYTVADLRFPCGRIRIEVSNVHPDGSKVVAALFSDRWGTVCRNVLNFFDAAPPVSPEDYRRGLGVRLTEPQDRPLRDEVTMLAALKGA